MQLFSSNIAFTQAEVEAVAGLSATYNDILREVSATDDTANSAAEVAMTETFLVRGSESD